MAPERYTAVVPATRDILRSTDHMLTVRLQKLGFSRASRGIFERVDPLAEADGWLGLNEAKRDGVQLFPFVGVRHREVEATFIRLGFPFDGPLGTVQLGYLGPDKAARSWTFTGKVAPDEATATDLTLSVERDALPFFERNRDLRTLAESILRHSDEDLRAYALPVVYYLLGERGLAEQAIDEELQNGESEAGLDYRRFVDHLFGLLDGDR